MQNSDRSPTCFTSQPGQVDWTLTPCLCWTPHRCLPLSCGADVRLASSVLSSPRHILLIGFFGDFFWEKPSSSRPSVSIRLRRPRARDERCAKHRLVEYFLDSCLGSRLFVRSRRFFMACPWIPLEEMEVVRSHPNRDNLTSRTCCVWGNTVVPEHPLHPIEQDLSIARLCRPKQVHSTFRGASSVPSPCFLGGTSVPAFLHHRLVC